jgi:hypothetical protein
MCMVTSSSISFYIELSKACTSLHTSLWDAVKPTKIFSTLNPSESLTEL